MSPHVMVKPIRKMCPARFDKRPRLRKQVVERDNFTCQDCDLVASVSVCGPHDGKRAPLHVSDDGKEIFFHIHHIIPRQLGGDHGASNLELLCPSCHSKKDAKLL